MEDASPACAADVIRRFEGQLNWGAMLVPWLWAPLHRLWGWTLLFWGLRALSLVVTALGRAEVIPARALALYPTLDWLLMVVLSTWFGLLANRALLSQLRQQGLLTSARFEGLAANQRHWAVIGAVFLVYILWFTVSRYSVAPLTLNLILVGVWLAVAWMINTIRLRGLAADFGADVDTRG